MKYSSMAVLTLCLGSGICWAEEAGTTEAPAFALESDNDKVLYSLGYELGKDIGRQELKLVPEVLLKGAEDALEGAKPLVSTRERRWALKQIKDGEAIANLEQSKAFLAANAQKQGVQTLPSGLQYRVFQAGEGRRPVPTDSVQVHYRGTLIDGDEFANSYAFGEPSTFSMNKVIPGWREALQLMEEGSKWELFIPPALAYGERGRAQAIPPNSLLIFEVELIKVL
jgi:FKBP-type peptidyl-prolyl cis-trans isomerase FklB